MQENPIFYRKWYDQGIKYINDIINENSEFLTPDQINEKFGFKPNFLENLQIRSAIPYQWKQIVKTQQNVTIRSTSLKFLHKW